MDKKQAIAAIVVIIIFLLMISALVYGFSAEKLALLLEKYVIAG